MIGVVADDLTGAAELGGIGWRHGLMSEIILRTGKPSPWADLICIDTDSRSSAPDEASRRTVLAVHRLQARRAKWLYKKTDSVLRGNVATELSAMLRALGLKRALLVPANPGLGRVIRRGRYYVRGVPLHRTEFACDPEHPRTSSRVLDLLTLPSALAAHSRKPGALLPGAGVIIGDVRNKQDLFKWAAQPAAMLLHGGGAEFFGALLAGKNRRARATRKQALLALKSERILFVCGSTSESARKFIADARRQRMPVMSLASVMTGGGSISPQKLKAALKQAVILLREKRCLMLQVGLPIAPHASPESFRGARSPASRLAQLAAAILRRVRVGALFAEGGTTALELARGMKWSRLTVLRELAPGVVMLGTGQHRHLRFTIKPGSYVWPGKVQAMIRDRLNTAARICEKPPS